MGLGWIDFAQKYAKDNNLKYNILLKDKTLMASCKKEYYAQKDGSPNNVEESTYTKAIEKSSGKKMMGSIKPTLMRKSITGRKSLIMSKTKKLQKMMKKMDGDKVYKKMLAENLRELAILLDGEEKKEGGEDPITESQE